MKSIGRIGNLKHIKAIVLVLLVLGGITGFSSVVRAQSGSQSSTQQFLFPSWLNEYLSHTSSYPSAVVVSPHSAVLVGTAYQGVLNGAPYGKPYSWVMSLTGYGNVTWAYTFSGAMVRSISSTGNGYVVVGTTHEWLNGASPTVNAWVAKLAPNGSVVWQEAIEPDTGMAVGVAFDGSNVLVAGTFGGKPWLVTLDSSGNVVWQKVGSGREYYGVSSVAGTSGAYVIGGYETSTVWVNGAKTGGVRPWVAEVDSSGNVVWQEALNISNTVVSKVYVAPNGHVLVIGNTPEGAWIACLSPSGKFMWGREYEGVELSSAAFLSTGDVVLVGSYKGASLEMRIAPSGEIVAACSDSQTSQITSVGTVGNAILFAGFKKDGGMYAGYVVAGSGCKEEVSVNATNLTVSTLGTNFTFKEGSYKVTNTSIGQATIPTSYKTVWNEKMYGLLDFETSPSSAAVYVDGQFAGRTPLYYYVRNGLHNVKITKLNYAEFNELITVSTGQVIPIQKSLLQGGYINVNTVPEGALVYVDGQFIGQTPLQNYSISAGLHVITIKKPGYVTISKFITVGIGSNLNINEYMFLAGYLRVITRPKGAAVYVDGHYIQDTPIENYTLPLGLHEITIIKQGYVVYDKFIAVTAGSLNVINTTLQLNATLYIESTPPNATAYVNGKYVGKTPLHIKLRPGNYTVKIELRNYQTAIRHVELTSNATMAVGAFLMPLNGTLYVESTPAGASVYINGEYMGKTPLKLSLKPGNYTVKIEESGYQVVTRHVDLTANATMAVGAVLQSG